MHRNLLLLALALSLTGCSSPSLNPMKWLFGRKAANVATTDAKRGTLEADMVKRATVEAYKTSKALKHAVAAFPEEPSIQLADRTNANALGLLQQVNPLSLADTQISDSIVEGLLSVEQGARKAAEKSQLRAEGLAADKSAALEDTRAKLKTALADSAKEAANNLELANAYRWSELQKWGGFALSGLLSIAVIAYRLNIGRLQQGAAEVLSRLGKDHGEEAESTARAALDAVLHTGEQRGVAKYVFALTKK